MSEQEGAGSDSDTPQPEAATAGGEPAVEGVPQPPFFAIALAIFGVADGIAPYVANAVGLTLYTLPVNEVVDHVIPGAIVILVAWLTLIRGTGWLGGSLLAMVAATWMVATHVPLLVQAGHGQVDLATALLHSTPGILVFLTAAAMTAINLMDARGRVRPDERGAAAE